MTNPEPSDAPTPNIEPGISSNPAWTAETPSTAWYNSGRKKRTGIWPRTPKKLQR